MNTSPRVIVCDVNETLLDVRALSPHFASTFGDAAVLKEWFSTMLLFSQVATLAGPYRDFDDIAGAALDMVADVHGTRVSEETRTRIVEGMRTLPPHPEVHDGLELMRRAGLRLFALSNSAPVTLAAQLSNSGLAPLFEGWYSVDTVRRFKPAPEPYCFVADSLRLPTNEFRMVAAHAWDIVGALRAGYAGAFVARPGKALYPLGPQPDIVDSDFRRVAQRIVAAT